ncbi:VWA domain-containing protein [Parasedimentitalea marina]|uniref:VWA domain-containing protein n=1 Tax=Parasedimentitalea marina TaxID=2483033 RepID=A0A3T0MZV3_9RHOB|nr:VWA domain-containing protein [Parasedimentitalea marina]AZV77304.1 VWA domain-containing protein [Parasedimentitalea marina]
MIRSILAACTACFFILSSASIAQEQSRAILVLDGSGSMWGQIDGRAKISIAQDVVGELLKSLPETQELGLTVYGHRRKGDCSDIETIIIPEVGRHGAIVEAVNSIKPKGKTPMTDAVIAAAEALRYTEEKASVILVSDGIETCNPDPCAAARALEETGVDFTAHVVGFNIEDPEAIAQMRCLAEETGGTFRTADTAAELSNALAVIATPVPAPEPEPDPVSLRAHAIDGRNGPRITEGLIWNLTSPDGAILENQAVADIRTELDRGEYVISVLRIADETFAERRFGIGSVDKQIVLELPEFRPPATIEGPATAVAGSTIQVRWSGPDQKGDLISVADPEASSPWINYTYTKHGPLLDLVMPSEEGAYELRYVSSDHRKVLATQAITVTPVEASITPSDTLPAGATVLIDWIGPDYQSDVIAVTEPGKDQLINYVYTKHGSPAELMLPPDPGAYDIVYRMSQKNRMLARVPVTVTGLQYSVSGPASAPAGSDVQIDWAGPDYRSDIIAVAEIGAGDRKYLSYTYTKQGSPLDLTLPLEPGRYEIRYILGQDSVVQAVTEIEVTEISASLTAPQSAPAGSTIQIDWLGPDYRGDIIVVSRPDDEDRSYLNYSYTKEGTPLDLTLPALPGDYVVKYLAGAERKVLAISNITVTEVSASLSAPATTPAGGKIEVTWDGPDYRGDIIAIGVPGENYLTYSYTRNGSPLTVTAPGQPGNYEIRYLMNTDRRVLTMIPLTVQ